MAAPKFRPVSPASTARAYASPDHVPAAWMPDRPAEVEGFQPTGDLLGAPGPDQGFALRIISALEPEIRIQDGEHLEDATRGCLGVALRRASMFSRAPVVHDLRIAFTIWGYFDAEPPADLLALRREMFEGLRHVNHHYGEARRVADLVPDATLRSTPAEVERRYPGEWRSLLGLDEG